MFEESSGVRVVLKVLNDKHTCLICAIKTIEIIQRLEELWGDELHYTIEDIYMYLLYVLNLY